MSKRQLHTFAMTLMKLMIFQKKTMIETKQLVDEIFSRQLSLGEELIACEAFKEIFLREVNKVYQNYKEEIVFCLKGKMSFRQIMDVIIGFFKKMSECLTTTVSHFCDDEVVDFSKKTIAETKQMLDEIFRLLFIKQNISCEVFKVYQNHKEEIISCLQRKLRLREIK